MAAPRLIPADGAGPLVPLLSHYSRVIRLGPGSGKVNSDCWGA
jgi:hypothetical protein